jgi:uncharacterized Zn finger protein
MSTRQTQIECDHCGCDQFVVFEGDDTHEPHIIYIECDACGASVLTLRAES